MSEMKERYSYSKTLYPFCHDCMHFEQFENVRYREEEPIRQVGRCQNPDATHYGHVLDHHPACDKFEEKKQ